MEQHHSESEQYHGYGEIFVCEGRLYRSGNREYYPESEIYRCGSEPLQPGLVQLPVKERYIQAIPLYQQRESRSERQWHHLDFRCRRPGSGHVETGYGGLLFLPESADHRLHTSGSTRRRYTVLRFRIISDSVSFRKPFVQGTE